MSCKILVVNREKKWHVIFGQWGKNKFLKMLQQKIVPHLCNCNLQQNQQKFMYFNATFFLTCFTAGDTLREIFQFKKKDKKRCKNICQKLSIKNISCEPIVTCGSKICMQRIMILGTFHRLWFLHTMHIARVYGDKEEYLSNFNVPIQFFLFC